MSIRPWLAAAALGLALFALAAHGQEVTEPPAVSEIETAVEGEDTAADSGRQPAPEPNGSLGLLSAIKGIESAIRGLVAEESTQARENERARNEADLRAQQEMARWSYWMMVFSGAAVALTGVGVILIWRTLLYTRDAAKAAADAVKEAENATAAARDSVKETKRLGEAQARAYLNITSANCEAYEDKFFVFVKIKNSGPTPAHILSIEYMLIRDQVGENRPSSGPFYPFDTSVTQVVAAADAESASAVWSYEQVGGDDFKFIFRPTPLAIVIVTVTWHDVFRKKQSARFLLGINKNVSDFEISAARPYRRSFNVQYVYTQDHDSEE